nr:immunoglobulin light chain junction region [Mus musculus]NSL99032.1 immunoglobulin light chain junction region [Mus musculus]NSL99255.1 immunoglobulin light chain junction region [Mus musculus]NSM01128.1 immunoglobulin light chain junction region [Mus musculus]NSM02804.1 immunoglobulin light chain junction region [Mus musculus]
CQHSRELPWTF